MNKTATIGKLRLSKVWMVRVKVAIPPRSFSSRRAVLAAGRIVLCKRAIFSLLSLIAWGRCAGQLFRDARRLSTPLVRWGSHSLTPSEGVDLERGKFGGRGARPRAPQSNATTGCHVSKSRSRDVAGPPRREKLRGQHHRLADAGQRL